MVSAYQLLCVVSVVLVWVPWIGKALAPPAQTHTQIHVIVVDVAIRALLFARLQIFRENRVEGRCRNRFGNAEYSIALSHVGGVGR